MTQIEARWTKLPKAEQGAIADQLAELQKGDWKKMTLEQKRAGKTGVVAVEIEFMEYLDFTFSIRFYPPTWLSFCVNGTKVCL